jgi:general secretion pathway protein H
VRRYPRPHPHEFGFTLIEIIVVITILALIGSLVLTRQPWHSAGLDTDATLRSLMNAMRLARSRAIAQDREVAVVTAPNGFSVDGTAPRTLPPDQVLSPSRVIFGPDGGSTGGTILLLAGQRRIVVDVNWLTGRVQARETANP